jgi:hypothetical protein
MGAADIFGNGSEPELPKDFFSCQRIPFTDVKRIIRIGDIGSAAHFNNQARRL